MQTMTNRKVSVRVSLVSSALFAQSLRAIGDAMTDLSLICMCLLSLCPSVSPTIQTGDEHAKRQASVDRRRPQ